VHFVDDVDLSASHRRQVFGVLADLAHGFDTVIGAPSISMTSTPLPEVISLQLAQASHETNQPSVAAFAPSQRIAFAKMRAIEVLPMPGNR